VAAEHTRRTAPRPGTCAAARSRGPGPILSRFCRDPGLSRDNSLNSGSYGPLRDHTYHITNVNDDATIPQTAKWSQNFLDPALNNFRQNQQGDIPPTALPDITSDTLSCQVVGDAVELSAEVCNRGVKTVGAGLKTAFYEGDPMDGKVLCVATTIDSLAAEQCVTVTCTHDGPVMGLVSVVGNDDGMGGKNTLECIYTNNDDSVAQLACQ